MRTHQEWLYGHMGPLTQVSKKSSCEGVQGVPLAPEVMKKSCKFKKREAAARAGQRQPLWKLQVPQTSAAVAKAGSTA